MTGSSRLGDSAGCDTAQPTRTFPAAMSDRVMELLSTPCFVRRLDIVGNRRTKRALIEAELRAALAARTHEDLAVELALASHRLKDLDVFKSASCEVDVLPEGGPGDVLVSLKVLVIQS